MRWRCVYLLTSSLYGKSSLQLRSLVAGERARLLPAQHQEELCRLFEFFGRVNGIGQVCARNDRAVVGEKNRMVIFRFLRDCKGQAFVE